MLLLPLLLLLLLLVLLLLSRLLMVVLASSSGEVAEGESKSKQRGTYREEIGGVTDYSSRYPFTHGGRY